VNGADGIRNGLYPLNIRMLDGINSSNSGIGAAWRQHSRRRRLLRLCRGL